MAAPPAPAPAKETSVGEIRGTAAARAAWCVYDWANSSFPAVILTFVFAAYFTRGVAAEATPRRVRGQGIAGSSMALVSVLTLRCVAA